MMFKLSNITFFVLIMGYATLHCQVGKTESREAYMQRVQQKEYEKYGLTEDKLNKLNEIGIDLQNGKASSREMIMAAYTDAVVVVKIVEILGWPGPAEQLFHTRVKACIQEVLKGKAIVGDTIELLQESGPLTGLEKANRVAVSTDVSFYIGEESIIYLRRMSKDNYLTSECNKKGFDLGNFESDSTHFYVGEGSKVLIEDGKCVINGKTIDVSQFKSDIKKVAAVLEK